MTEHEKVLLLLSQGFKLLDLNLRDRFHSAAVVIRTLTEAEAGSYPNSPATSQFSTVAVAPVSRASRTTRSPPGPQSLVGTTTSRSLGSKVELTG
jgi:hypothetical protein